MLDDIGCETKWEFQSCGLCVILTGTLTVCSPWKHDRKQKGSNKGRQEASAQIFAMPKKTSHIFLCCNAMAVTRRQSTVRESKYDKGFLAV